MIASPKTDPYLVVLAIGVFGDVFSLLQLSLQERDALIVGQAAAFKCFAVPAHSEKSKQCYFKHK